MKTSPFFKKAKKSKIKRKSKKYICQNSAKKKLLVRFCRGERGQGAVNYAGTQSFIDTIFLLVGSKTLGTFIVM